MAVTVPAINDNNFLTQVGVLPGLFDAAACAKAIALAQRFAPSAGRIGTGNDNNRELRRSEIWFFEPGPETAFMFNVLRQAALHLNEGFGFDLTGFAHGCQIARYRSEDAGHYDWHIDLGTGPSSRRKLSLSVQLNHPTDYDGGDLEFQLGGLDPEKMRAQGTLIAFASFMQHRVTPVTRGERWSLVAWIEGPPYR